MSEIAQLLMLFKKLKPELTAMDLSNLREDELGQQLTAPTRPKVDGRKLRATGRTTPLSLRVTNKFDNQLREIAQREGSLLAEVLEKAVDSYLHFGPVPK